LSKITVIKGDDRTLGLIVYTDSTLANRFSLADCDLWFTVKNKASDSDADAVIQKTSAASDEINVTDAAQGEAEIYLLPEDTESLPAVVARLFFDVQVKGSDGKIKTVSKGSFVVEPDVTLDTALA